MAASIPLANAIVPKAWNTTTASGSGQTILTIAPAGTATATVTGAPRGGGTATVFTTVVVGPSGMAAGNSTARSTGRPAQVTGGGVAAGVMNGTLANAGTPSIVPFTSGGYRLGAGEMLLSVVIAVAAAMGTFVLTVRP